MNFKQFLRPGKGASDITPLLLDNNAYHELIIKLTKLNEIKSVDKIACIEGRGFLLGSAVAFNLNLGIIPIRSKGKLKNETFSLSYTDYSNRKKELEIHKDAIKKGEKIILVDDWVETGSTLKAAITLIEKCGGNVVGIVAFMDASNDELKNNLARYNYKYLEKVSKVDLF